MWHGMRRFLFPGLVVMWAIAVTITVVSAADITASVKHQGRTQTQVERELVRLQREHRILLEYVAQELRPWLIHTTYKQSAALPSGVPTPSLAPLPPVPSASPTPSLSPSPSISVEPSPSLAPSPSLCLPIICEGSASP